MADAIVRAATQATSSQGVPASRDLKEKRQGSREGGK
jgi:hypothetical protein